VIDGFNLTNATIDSNVIMAPGLVDSVSAIRISSVRGSCCNNVCWTDNATTTHPAIWVNSINQDCVVGGNSVTGWAYGVWVHDSGTNSGNVIFGNILKGQSIAPFLDDSGQTNYYYGDWTLGKLTVPGALTTTGGIAGGIPRNVGTWQPFTSTPGSYKQPVTSEMYVGSIFVPANMTVTGIQYLIGTATPTTQKVIAALYNQAGTKVAVSVAGGTTMTGTPSIKQQLAFTGSTYAAVGPAWYFIGLMFDTATSALVAMIPAVGDVGSGVVGSAVTGLTAVTPPASITPPTTFPGAAIVPIASLY
jgi:hypothetical protein